MLQKVESAIEVIAEAIEKGMTQRAKSEKEIDERSNSLVETSAKLNIISARLTTIKEKALGGSSD